MDCLSYPKRGCRYPYQRSLELVCIASLQPRNEFCLKLIVISLCLSSAVAHRYLSLTQNFTKISVWHLSICSRIFHDLANTTKTFQLDRQRNARLRRQENFKKEDLYCTYGSLLTISGWFAKVNDPFYLCYLLGVKV